MHHKPIHIKQLCLSFSHKTCFEDINAQIIYGNRIAIVGRNGTGKSSLLKMLHGSLAPTSGNISIPSDAIISYVPQIMTESDSLSGGERFNQAITAALCNAPNILLLDEPTNHLDMMNRHHLIRLLKTYTGTLVVVSHDKLFLKDTVDTIWHLENEHIHLFSGNYENYLHEIQRKRSSIENELTRLHQEKKSMHHALMQEQHRAAKSRSKGEKSIDQNKWPTVVSKTKALKSQETSGRKKSGIDRKRQQLSEQLSQLHLAEIIVPKFSLSAESQTDYSIVSISQGAVGYSHIPILHNIHFILSSTGRIAVTGRNGSGKSTFIKAILNDPTVIKSGHWCTPKSNDIGYLDQHYNTLDPKKSVVESIAEIAPFWGLHKIRMHLSDFLFRTNEEVNALISHLSGGERARLSLATIATITPKLLILDEVTNNLDLQTRQHTIEVLKSYPGSMIVISHDSEFLKEINVVDHYPIEALI